MAWTCRVQAEKLSDWHMWWSWVRTQVSQGQETRISPYHTMQPPWVVHIGPLTSCGA